MSAARRMRRQHRRDRWSGAATIGAARGESTRQRAMLRAIRELGPAIDLVPPDHVIGVVRVHEAMPWLVTPIARKIHAPEVVRRAIASADRERDQRGLRAEDVIVVIGADDTHASAMLVERGPASDEREEIVCTAPGGEA